jgi:hypothetical protein
MLPRPNGDGVNVDDEVDRLYGLPLDQFTAERNTLARELGKAGESEAVDRVKALPKPSISAWVVNQLARRERLQMRSLLTAGDRLRKAQEELLGGGTRTELQEAVERQREVVAALLESAKEVLRLAGHPATDATLERVRGTLTSAAADEEGKRLVEEGQLTEDLDPAGFGPLAFGAGAARTPPRRAKRAPEGDERKPAQAKSRREEAAARKKRVEAARQELERLRAELSERKANVRRAKAEAGKAARAAEAAQKAAEKQENELEQLSGRLDEAKEAFDRARSG